MISYVFLCDNITEQECLKRLLFGVDGRTFRDNGFKYIKQGDTIFLYNYNMNYLKGPYKSLTVCSKDIEQDAFRDYHFGGFPNQIRIEEMFEEEKVLNNLRSYLGNRFCLRLDDYDTERIMNAMETEKLTKIIYGEHYYIFKCNKRTGGTVFDNNIMGAPIEAFRKVVGRIRCGDIIFVWVIEENRLYGIWKAVNRGKYTPYAFSEVEGKFTATVECRREVVLSNGINFNQLKNILRDVNFLGDFPPCVIPKKEGDLILEEISKINNIIT